MEVTTPIAAERDPSDAPAPRRPFQQMMGRDFVVPDAALPGPIGRYYPIDDDVEEDDVSSGGDCLADMDGQNADRI